MAARPYRASGLSESGAIQVLFFGTLAAGTVIGVAESELGRWVRLLVVFPLVAGILVGLVARWTIGRRRVRAPVAAALIAGLGGLATQLACHLTDYYRFRSAVAFEEVAPGQGKPIQRRPVAVDEALAAQTGSTGFLGYLKLRAREGVGIERGGREVVRAQGMEAFALWGVEAILAIGVAAALAANRASQPFCERCRTWYGADETVAVGSADKGQVREVVAALDARDPARAAAALGAPGDEAQSLLALRRCPRCPENEPLLSYSVITNVKKKPQSALKYRTLLRPEEASALRAAFTQPRAPPA